MISQDDTQQLMLDLKEIFRRLVDLEANPFSLTGGAVPAAGTPFNHLEDDGAAWTSVSIANFGTVAGGGGERLALRVDQNAPTAQEVVNASGGVAAAALYRAKNVSGAGGDNALSVGVLGTGFTTVAPVYQDSGIIQTGVNLSGGLTIRTLADVPIYFATAATRENMRVSSVGLIVNNGEADLGTRIAALNVTNALFVAGATGYVGINVAAPGAQLSIDQSGAAANIPVLKVDQADVSEPCIQFSVSGVDADLVLWELEVAGTPSLSWDESEDALRFSHALSVRAIFANAEGLYVPWISGDAATTAYFGSGNASNDQDAITGESFDANGVRGITESGAAAGVRGEGGTLGTGVHGISTANIGTFGVSSNSWGVGAQSATGVALVANLTGVGTIAEFRDNGASILTIQDGGQADFAEYLRHLGDADTFWRLQTDQASLDCGGVTFLNAVEAGTDFLNLHAGLVGINSAGGNSAYGTINLAIDMDVNDDEILTLQSSTDVTHGMTDLAATNTFGAMGKVAATAGGLKIEGYTETTTAIRMFGYITTDVTTKTSSSVSAIMTRAAKKSGTSFGNVASGQNVFGIQSRTGGAWRNIAIFAEDGDMYLDTVVNENHWDEHDDLALLHGLRASLVPDGHQLQRRFGEWTNYARPILERTGVIVYNDDGHHFVATKKLQMLTIDALRQVAIRAFGRIEILEQRIGVLENGTK